MIWDFSKDLKEKRVAKTINNKYNLIIKRGTRGVK